MRFLLGTSPLIIGFALTLWQCFQYLQDGVWQSISMLDVLVALDIKWAANPTSWTGLAKIVGAIPGSLGLMLIGIGFTLAAANEPAAPDTNIRAPRVRRVQSGSLEDFLSLALFAVIPIALLAVPVMSVTSSSEGLAWGRALLLGVAAGAVVLLIGRFLRFRSPACNYRTARTVVLGFWWAMAGYIIAALYYEGGPHEVRAGYAAAGLLGMCGACFHALRTTQRTKSDFTEIN